MGDLRSSSREANAGAADGNVEMMELNGEERRWPAFGSSSLVPARRHRGRRALEHDPKNGNRFVENTMLKRQVLKQEVLKQEVGR
jgi:hypothetical protein